jgi:hypothetical protein
MRDFRIRRIDLDSGCSEGYQRFSDARSGYQRINLYAIEPA